MPREKKIAIREKGRPRRPWRRTLLASARDVRALLREFGWTLGLFGFLVLAGAAVMHRCYVDPESGRHLGGIEALFAVFCLIFVQPTVAFPEPWYLRALFFIVPILGLGLLGEGMVRFGVLLFNKQARLEEWQVALASTHTNHIVVCGVGRLGFRVVEQLLACGEDVVAVEKERECPFLEKVRAQHVPVILGDACRPEILRKAGIAHARAVIPCTENDLANLEIALNARELNAPIQVVLRMFEPELAKKVGRGFGIPTALSTSALAAPAFAAAATQAEVSHAFYVEDTLLHVAQMCVGPGCSGRTVGAIEGEFDLSIMLHQVNGKADLHPAPGLVLKQGDRIVIFATVDVLARFRKANAGG